MLVDDGNYCVRWQVMIVLRKGCTLPLEWKRRVGKGRMSSLLHAFIPPTYSSCCSSITRRDDTRQFDALMDSSGRTGAARRCPRSDMEPTNGLPTQSIHMASAFSLAYVIPRCERDTPVSMILGSRDRPERRPLDILEADQLAYIDR